MEGRDLVRRRRGSLHNEAARRNVMDIHEVLNKINLYSLLILKGKNLCLLYPIIFLKLLPIIKV